MYRIQHLAVHVYIHTKTSGFVAQDWHSDHMYEPEMYVWVMYIFTMTTYIHQILARDVRTSYVRYLRGYYHSLLKSFVGTPAA